MNWFGHIMFITIGWLFWGLAHMASKTNDFDSNRDGYDLNETGHYFKKHKLLWVMGFLFAFAMGAFEMSEQLYAFIFSWNDVDIQYLAFMDFFLSGIVFFFDLVKKFIEKFKK